MKKKICLIFFLAMAAQCSTQKTIQTVERTEVMMDTFIQISIYADDPPVAKLEHIIELAFNRIKEIDRACNDYVDSSFISLINREAGQRPVFMDSIMFDLVTESQQISKLSDGAFDITIGSVKQLWNFTEENPRMPGLGLLQRQLEWVGMDHLKIDGSRIQFDSPKVKIDLGAIAKGYAVDAAIEVLLKNGISDAMVNAGGNLRTLSSKLTKGKRRVWIKHPREQNLYFGSFPMDEGAVATSGDYERFFIADSIRYHHILDPKTGYPARDCVSVTIKARTAMEADALSTAIFVLGPEKGMALINRLPDADGIIIFERDGKLNWIASAGVKKIFKAI